MYTPKFLRKWDKNREGRDYFGEDLSEWYIFKAKTRDSEILDESNFDCILKDFPENPDALQDKQGILLAEFGHWACGWIKVLFIHESDEETLFKADDVAEGLSNYPVYDEEDYSRRESEAQYESALWEVEYWLKNNVEEYTQELAEKITHEFCQNARDSSSFPEESEIEELYNALKV